MKFLDSIPYRFLLPTALILGLAPFAPEPHLLEKLRMLSSGQLSRLIDVVDLLLHASPVVLLVLKFVLSRRAA